MKTFDQIWAMDETRRAALRQELYEREEPIALSVAEIQKKAQAEECDFATALCAIMKANPNQYRLYRQQNFKAV